MKCYNYNILSDCHKLDEINDLLIKKKEKNTMKVCRWKMEQSNFKGLLFWSPKMNSSMTSSPCQKNQMVKLEGLVPSHFFQFLSSKILRDLSITKIHSFLKQCCVWCSFPSKQWCHKGKSAGVTCFEGNEDREQHCLENEWTLTMIYLVHHLKFFLILK